ncbi:DUF1311 domain-containing protein [Brenneria sp. 4F2]|nr:DUF1311 domain-containing protein [Brenneria bubanii]
MKKFTLAITLLVSISSHAAQPHYTSEYNQCIDASGGITASMRKCISEETKKQDNLLNNNYKKYISSLYPETRQQFIEAQRLWVKYRDANCSAFASEEEGGTLALIIIDSCYLDMTASRAADFAK